MKVLITGASSGIGAEFARKFSEMGFDLVLVARRKERLLELAERLGGNVKVIATDISSPENCIKLFEQVKDDGIDILINNAGFGIYGEFCRTELEKELSMINTNISGMHILMKLFLKHFQSKNSGYILNVASSAAFLPGPLMSSYYASKAYVLRITQAVSKELKLRKSSVYVGVLCPGPVNTEFNAVAGVEFNLSSLSAEQVVKCAIKKMFKGKTVIVTGFIIKSGTLISKFIPAKILLHISYLIQKKKS